MRHPHPHSSLCVRPLPHTPTPVPVLTAGRTGEARVMIEVPHGLAGLSSPKHPFAALHTRSCKATTHHELGVLCITRGTQGFPPHNVPVTKSRRWHLCVSFLWLSPRPSLLPQPLQDLPMTETAASRATCPHSAQPMPTSGLSQTTPSALRICKTKSKTWHSDQDTPSNQVQLFQLNDLPSFSVGTTTGIQQLHSAKKNIRSQGPGLPGCTFPPRPFAPNKPKEPHLPAPNPGHPTCVSGTKAFSAGPSTSPLTFWLSRAEMQTAGLQPWASHLI